jgi:GNAT superfamily N-acetyltransferase
MHTTFHEQVPLLPFNNLFSLSMGRSMPVAEFEWKYTLNPHGRAVAWAVSEPRSKEWLGSVTLMPRLFRVGGKVLRAGQIVDLVVAPERQRQGIFRHLIDRVWSEHIEHGFDLLFTLPLSSGVSISGFRTMTFMREVGRFRTHTRLLRPDPLLERMVPIPGLRSLATPFIAGGLLVLDRSQSNASDFEQDVPFSSDEEGFVVNGEWVNWRLATPGTRLQSFGWKGGGALVALRVPGAEIYALRAGVEGNRGLWGVLRFLRDNGSSSVELSGRMLTISTSQLRSMGFIKRRGDSLVCFAGSPRWDDELARAFERATLSRADLDVP